MHTYKNYLVLTLFIVFVSCQQKETMFSAVDATVSGIGFSNDLQETDDFNILDYLYFYNGGGTAIGDINNDGLPDIFLSGNQVENRLYLNRGDLQFEDITLSAGIEKNSDWNTGAIMGDVNQDGWLDIYVCAVVGLKGLTGYNELYINNGDNTFSEQSSKYGLDFDSYSSSAAFLDFDLDGDLDIYLLNHAVHTPESFGKAELRYSRSYETGDKLLRNDSLRFTDVSEEAGIYGGINSYGLGLAISDFNQDGFPDIYVGNDFHEDDYYYLNNGDGTFTESLQKAFGLSSRFSMGNDVADINNDGISDLLSLDMLPEDETVLKMSEGDENYNVMRLRKEEYGYSYQFSRNMLFYGHPSGSFLETAQMSGVAASDWSWSALFGDFDMDGNQDLYISNGIPKRPNDLDFIKFVSGEQIKNTINQTKLVDQQALDLMPNGAAINAIFKGDGQYEFENMTDRWYALPPSYSTSSAYADLDGDGDLDIVTNNVNAKAFILKNDANGNYLKIKLKDPAINHFGIGAKVYLHQRSKVQFREMYTARGFQSSSEPTAHFGLTTDEQIDSVRIIWPDRSVQVIKNVSANQELVVMKNATLEINKPIKLQNQLLKSIELLSFNHREDRYVHFDRQKLIPFQASDRGPAVGVGDINGDGKDDIFFGGSKFFSSEIFYQHDTGFYQLGPKDWQKKNEIKEDVVAAIADLNNDGKMDLFVGQGGADFFGKSDALSNTMLINTESGFQEVEIPKTYENTSVVKPFDFDEDGDLDVFVGSHSITTDYGSTPASYLLENENGSFRSVNQEVFSELGMLNDAIWTDFDGDSRIDLIVVGEWQSPTFLRNTIDGFKVWDAGLDEKGLWFCITEYDVDRDGDLDYVLGNWGLNSKFQASKERPMKMYYGDLDANGTSETIVAIYKEDDYYPIESFDELASQMVELRKQYNAYKDVAGKSVSEIFASRLSKSELFQVNQLSSGFLESENGSFRFSPLPALFQMAPIMTLAHFDVDMDQSDELIVAGNYFGVKPMLGRLGSFPGAVLWTSERYLPGHEVGLNLLNKQVADLSVVNYQDKEVLLVTVNNGDVETYEVNDDQKNN